MSQVDPDQPSPLSQADLPLFNVAQPTNQTGFTVELMVDQKPLVMELDAGSTVSQVSEKTWDRMWGYVPLENADIWL